MFDLISRLFHKDKPKTVTKTWVSNPPRVSKRYYPSGNINDCYWEALQAKYKVAQEEMERGQLCLSKQ